MSKRFRKTDDDIWVYTYAPLSDYFHQYRVGEEYAGQRLWSYAFDRRDPQALKDADLARGIKEPVAPCHET